MAVSNGGAPARSRALSRRPLRVIAGHWKGRRLQFPGVPGLRPTSDRVRETLFNWLAPHITGMRCLDLFAGSGILSLEALSRGAQSAVCVEKNPLAAQAIVSHMQTWGISSLQGKVFTGCADQFLQSVHTDSTWAPWCPFDLVFWDPPFAADAQHDWKLLLEAKCMAPIAYVYCEIPRDESRTPAIPSAWQIWREGVAGQVAYRLLRTAP